MKCVRPALAALALAGSLAAVVVIPAQASASDWVSSRGKVQSWIWNHWNNVDSVRCYGREYDHSTRRGTRYFGWFSCATSFYSRRDGYWSEVAEVTPTSLYGFHYHRTRTFD